MNSSITTILHNKVASAVLTAGLIAAVGSIAAVSAAPGNSNPSINGYTKDQCKNGGWQSLGFKNQGDCVSYFATGGKNPPSPR